MTDFYKSLGTVNDDEQNRLGLLQQKFNAAIGKGNDTQTTIAIVDFEVNLPLEESLFVFDREKYFEELNYYENIID